MLYLDIILPLPFHRFFEYAYQITNDTISNVSKDNLASLIGRRVLVPFGQGNRQRVGLIIKVKEESTLAKNKIKQIGQLLDSEPLLDNAQLELMTWLSHYYHAPLGEVMLLFLPPWLRKNRSTIVKATYLTITPLGVEWLQNPKNDRAYVKKELLNQLAEVQAEGIDEEKLKETYATSHLTELYKADLISKITKPVVGDNPTWQQFRKVPYNLQPSPPFTLTEAQKKAITVVCHQQQPVYLLEGVTSSGKTAVYIEIARHYLKKGQQVLLLLPEIGLTEQHIKSIEESLGARLGVIHSRLTEKMRYQMWEKTRQGEIDLLVGTRSALFTPFHSLGTILIDEAHDDSYYQQDGVRYSAIYAALKRGTLLNIPILLGTATPQLEFYANITHHHWQHLTLPERVKGKLPHWQIIDKNKVDVYDGLSKPLLDTIEETLARGEQALLFLNRRGYSPVIRCISCGFMPHCPYCDSYLNYHRLVGRRRIRVRGEGELQCHHCGYKENYKKACRECKTEALIEIGIGTQKLEKALMDAFPNAHTIRFDTDSMTKKEAFDTAINTITQGEANLIVGTQMLAKGHDFHNITLVALIDPDGLFFSNDFRAEEKLAQILMQVSGRAGRSNKEARVVIQTYFPDHEVFTTLPKIGYQEFSKRLLEERKTLELPPFSYQAVIQVEAKEEERASQYLHDLIATLPPEIMLEVQQTPIMPNHLSRRQGYYRYFTLLQAKKRRTLHRALFYSRQLSEANPQTGVRVLLTVDPREIG